MGLKELKKKLEWLDPFTYVDLWVMPRVNPNKNKTIEWIVYLFFALVFAVVLFTILGLVLGTKNPMVIVVSASMEPVLARGDVVVLLGVPPEKIKGNQVELDMDLEGKMLKDFAEVDYAAQKINFVNGQSIPLEKNGDTAVYYSDIGSIQIIHRVVGKIKTPQGIYLLTKGDNVLTNKTVDQDCGGIILEQLENKNLLAAGKQWYPYDNYFCYCAAPPSSPVVMGQACYVCTERPCNTIFPIKAEKIDGIAVTRVPVVGCVKLWLFDDLSSLILRGQLPTHFKGIC